MKITAPAATLANALGTAASLVAKNEPKRPAAVGAARLVGGDHLTLIVSNRTAELTITIEVDAEGEVAVPARRLAELVANFPPDAEITITTSDIVATVSAGRSRFKLPTIALADLQAPLALIEETGRVVLSADNARDLICRVTFAAETEQPRFYLCGIHLHDGEDSVAAVATNGIILARSVVSAATSLSQDRRLIVPTSKIIPKLLGIATGDVTIRRSVSLIEIAADNFKLVSRLIDYEFPLYAHLIAKPTSTVITDRAKLVQSVERLGLSNSVYPVAAAVIDNPRPVRISYSERNSLLAQIHQPGLNPRGGDKIADAKGVTLDEISSLTRTFPQLLKIDAEGSEAAVFRGSQRLLSRPDRPAILFECNAATLVQCGESVATLTDLLGGYALYYVNDYCGQKIPFGDPVENPAKIDWVCNLFAVPVTESGFRRWTSVLKHRH